MPPAHIGRLGPGLLFRKTPMTCSSVNLDRFMVRSFQTARTLASDGGNDGGQVTALLYADLRDFTALSEATEPAVLLQLSS